MTPMTSQKMPRAEKSISQNLQGLGNADYVESSFRPWRVFVNQIDSYHGKKLAEFIPEQFYNPRNFNETENNEEEEGEEEEDAGGPEASGDEDINEEVNPRRREKKRTSEMVRKYEVVGTLMDNQVEAYRVPEDVSMIINDHKNRDTFLKELMKCGVIVYDITQDFSQISEAQWALEAISEELKKLASEKPKAFKRSVDIRHFILISTAMTWALSKPLYADDPELPFTEADYRKRKPHKNFNDHNQCEKEVVMIKKIQELKDKLRTIVICCGITYGDEEGPLHYLFKMGWLNETKLPIFGKGNNNIPLLHVRNIPKIILMLLQNWPKLRYLVAVEQVRMSQKRIVKNISKAMTTGKVTDNISLEEALTMDDVTENSYDMMNLNLNIEPAYLADENIEWHTDLPFDNNIKEIVREYKSSRNLNPVKIIVLGPPASGKSRLGKILAEHYRLHYINAKSLITETMKNLINDIEDAKKSANIQEQNEITDGENNYEGEEEEDGIETLQNELDEINKNLSENQDRLDDRIFNKIIVKKLMSKECQNQGYVLDGYPKSLNQAREIFENYDGHGDEDELDEEEDDGGGREGGNKIMPELVAVLVASEEFLTERLLNLTEAEIQGTHYTEEHIIRRFREYRERNTEDNTPLKFFDEIEIHPVFIYVEDDPCPNIFSSFNICLKKIGPPRNYGLGIEELADIQKRKEGESRTAEIAEMEKKIIEQLDRKNQREKKMMEWTNLLEKLKEEEENQLCIVGQPLRDYLVEHVFPTLTQGLVNVAELRPEDPVDYLAEYLFKENPEGKMFEPDYTETMNMLLEAMEKFQTDILPFDELEKGESEYLKTKKKDSEKTDKEVKEEYEVSVDCPHYQTGRKS